MRPFTETEIKKLFLAFKDNEEAIAKYKRKIEEIENRIINLKEKLNSIKEDQTKSDEVEDLEFKIKFYKILLDSYMDSLEYKEKTWDLSKSTRESVNYK